METDKPHELELLGQKHRSPKTVHVQMLLFVWFCFGVFFFGVHGKNNQKQKHFIIINV